MKKVLILFIILSANQLLHTKNIFEKGWGTVSKPFTKKQTLKALNNTPYYADITLNKGGLLLTPFNHGETTESKIYYVQISVYRYNEKGGKEYLTKKTFKKGARGYLESRMHRTQFIIERDSSNKIKINKVDNDTYKKKLKKFIQEKANIQTNLPQ